MHLSEEILDHIFSFLVSHRETLIACSKDPVLSSIVKRHLHYHLIVNIGNYNRETASNYALKPDHLAKLISEDPRILYSVRVLQIQLELDRSCQFWMPGAPAVIAKHLDGFASLLLMFPVLERIMLTGTSEDCPWYWPDAFRTALEDRLSLPTIKEVHIEGVKDFSFSLLDNCNNLKNLSLFGPFVRMDHHSVSTVPRLQSLSLSNTFFIDPPFMAWIKSHINELRSLKCSVELRSGQRPLSALLEVCSQTLNKLDVSLGNLRYSSGYTRPPGPIPLNPLHDFAPLPPNLQQLTIRTEISLSQNEDCCSWLPSAARIIELFMSSLQHLVLDIDIILSTSVALTKVDLSPLAVLGSAPLSISRIDLYVHTQALPPAVTYAQLLRSLSEYEEIVKLVKEGVLVIHSEKTAPDACDLDTRRAKTSTPA